jgi:hypothetical protein
MEVEWTELPAALGRPFCKRGKMLVAEHVWCVSVEVWTNHTEAKHSNNFSLYI